jgi:hypothetical protein
MSYYERVVAATGDAEVAARLRDVKAEVESIPDCSQTHSATSSEAPRSGSDGSQVMERGRRLETMRQPEDAACGVSRGTAAVPGA